MILLSLFTSFLQIGAFSFGGGYAAMPLIQEQVITRHGWLTMSDFTDLVTVAEMTPGPIAVNGATFVGNQVAGIPGAIAATIGEEPDTIEDVYEPYLMQLGYIARTPRGRIVTKSGYAHFGIKMPE